MNSSRKCAVIAGVLFIIGTAAGVLSLGFTKTILGVPDYLAKISANENQIITGALFQLIMAFACSGIAISLYPVLRKYNEGLALGSVGFRLIEGVLDVVGVICLLVLLTLSREFIKGGTPDSSYFQTLGALLLAGREWVNLTMLLAWCIGALMYYSVFYRTRLIPRWLSGWGIIGITLVIAVNILVMFRIVGNMSTVQVVLSLPIALQEMVLAVWLIVKGFDSSAIASGAVKQI